LGISLGMVVVGNAVGELVMGLLVEDLIDVELATRVG